jgi:prepilin-type processing-associated H-X9-DG protein
VLWLYVMVLMGSVLLFGHSHWSPRAVCLNNMKQLGSVLTMYQADWDDRFPPLYTTWQRAPSGKAWMDKLLIYAKNKHITRCPEARDRLTYSFNRYLSGIKDAKIADPADTVAVFESLNDSPSNNNLNGDKALLPAKGRLPAPGSYVMWPQSPATLYRNWPDWARPNHEDVTNVLYADGHAKRIQWGYEGPPYEPRLWPK